MISPGTLKIESERIVLRPFKKIDALSVFRNWISIKEVQKSYGEPVYSTQESVIEYLTYVEVLSKKTSLKKYIIVKDLKSA